MAGHLVIERLEFQGHCGIIPEERQVPQPIAVDLELYYETDTAATTDDIDRAVDYAQVSERVVEVGLSQDCCLVETLAERIVNMVFAEFPVSRVQVWLRKLAPPLKQVLGSVGVRLDRTRMARTAWPADPPPARFLIEQLHRLPKGKTLDVAAGRGRNALYLAAQGYSVDGLDRDSQALAILAATAKERNLTKNISVRHVDFEADPLPPTLPKGQYDIILVFFYLYRPLFPALLEALKPDGVLIYETFLIDNHLLRHHPRHWEFCLAHNELLRLSSGLRVLHYDEGEHEGGHGNGSAFTARLVAQSLSRETQSK
jgi:dihydroneopterin aldolase